MMTIGELQALESALVDHICDVFESMPDNGTTEWDLRKIELINRVMGELSNIVVELE